MKIRFFALLAVATLMLAACGLRDNPAVPPAHKTPAPTSMD